jgi:hypothetical protein
MRGYGEVWYLTVSWYGPIQSQLQPPLQPLVSWCTLLIYVSSKLHTLLKPSHSPLRPSNTALSVLRRAAWHLISLATRSWPLHRRPCISVPLQTSVGSTVLPLVHTCMQERFLPSIHGWVLFEAEAELSRPRSPSVLFSRGSSYLSEKNRHYPGWRSECIRSCPWPDPSSEIPYSVCCYT